MLKHLWLLSLLAIVAPISLFSQTPVVNAKKRTVAITIDGNPNESNWDVTNSATKAIVGTPNNTVKFGVLWDEQNLYIAYAVTDGTRYNDSPNNWDDDAVEVYIDADNNGGMTYGTNDRQFAKEWNGTLWERTGKTTGVQHAWANTATGYTVELRIPWSNIGISNAAVGRTIGFDIAIDDDDNGGARESQLMWAGDNDNWQYPRNFGDLVLAASDTQAPAAPGSLAASAVTGTSLTLTWTASTDNVGVAGYDVYRNGTKINSSVVTTTSYTVTGLTQATAYSFYIQAKDAAGNISANSNTASVTTLDTQAPTAPTGLAAAVVELNAFLLSWTASTDNVGVTGYDIYQDNVKILTVTGTTTVYTINSLAPGTTYQFYIKAFDAAGNVSANSSTLSVTTLLPPDTEAPTAPSNLTASAITQSSLTLSWTAATDNRAVTGYDVYQDGTKINSMLVTGTNYAVSGLVALTSHDFYVVAKDAAGNISANSNTVSVTTPDTQAPTAPAGLSATNVTAVSVTINWNASADNIGVTGYDVYQNGTKINSGPVTTTSYDVTGLSQGSSYNFTVKAFDAAGNISASSNTLTVTTLDTEAPTAPSGLAASAITQSSLTLTWTASADNKAVAGYDIYQDNVKLNSSLVTGTSYAVSGLTVLTSYDFYVVAKDATGNQSANSNTITVATPDTQAPSAPSGLAASDLGTTSVSLNWNASADNVGVTGYDIYQNGTKINDNPVTATVYDITTLSQASSYSFYVKAFDAAGNQSANSNTIVVNTPDMQAPTAPGSLTSSNLAATSVTLNWTASTDNVGVTGYDVYRNGIKINGSVVTTTSYSVTGLTASTAYNFYVQARDAAGNISVNSNTINITTSAVASCSGTGAINFQKWNNITGTSVTNLTSASTYPNSPGTTGTLTSFEIPTNSSDNYGMKVYGYICPPATGSYTFWIASDDNSELWLSTTSNPANKVKIAYNTSWTNSREWNKAATQKSAAITLTAGQLYYVEALMKEGSQGDNMAVGWAKPGQATSTPSEVIPGSQLIASIPDTQAPTAPTNLASSALTQTTLTLTWTASTDNKAVTGYDVYRNGVKINTAVVTTTSYAVTGLTASTAYSFYVQARDAAGNISANSNTINVTTPAPPAGCSGTGAINFQKWENVNGTAVTDLTSLSTYPNSPTTSGTLTSFEAPVNTTDNFGMRVYGYICPPTSGTYTFWIASDDNSELWLSTTSSPANKVRIAYNASWTNSREWNKAATQKSAVITLTAGQLYYVEALMKEGSQGDNLAVGWAKPGQSTSTPSEVIPGTQLIASLPDPEAPTSPANLSATGIAQTSFTLGWTAATDNIGIAGYDVYRNGTKINTSTVGALSYSVTGLTAGTTYSFTVIAKDLAGNSSAVSTALVVTTLPPNPGLETFTQRTVIANQRMPHDLVYGPDNNIWYTERFAGTVSFVNPATGAKTIVLSLGSAFVNVGGQDGLLGLALHPQFKQGKPYVYISYTYQSVSTNVRKTRIARYTYDSVSKTLGQAVTIQENIPGSNDHNSARLAIGPDLKLYYSVGDMGAGQFENLARTNNAQNLNILEGKILRFNTELTGGSWIPADNPFSNAGVKTPVYTYGHRNPQGLVWGNVNGVDILYSSEHGPYSDDELNIIETGRNYGWPLVAGFCDGNYNGRYLGGGWVGNEQNNCTTLNVREPIRSLFPVSNPPDSTTDNMTWPSTAPSGTEFYGSTAIPGWQNSLLVAELKKGAVARFKLSSDGRSIISDTINYFQGKGRFRDVVVSPDGTKIYVSCDSEGNTSGPTNNVTSTPANPGSILEFTYVPPAGGSARRFTELVATEKPTSEMIDRTMDVYPNPASSFFVVYNYAADAGRIIELLDIGGKVIRKQMIINLATRIDISNVANGLYILKVTDKKGNVVRTEKIVVQK